MNLCKPTLNLHANLMIHGTSKKVPVIGEAATVCYAKDRHAATIIDYDPCKDLVTIQQDTATRTDSRGMSEDQDYTYTANPQGRTYTFKLKDDKWREVYKSDKGRWKLAGCGVGLILGIREEFYDFTF